MNIIKLINSFLWKCFRKFWRSSRNNSQKDFIFKVSLVVKELKESRNSLKILEYIKEGDEEKRNLLLIEVEELIAISSKMIINKK